MFDPANFLGNADNKVSELRRWRESEITHGRVAMLGSLGFLTQEIIEVHIFPYVQFYQKNI